MPIPAAVDAPLIVTAHLDAAAFAALDALRRRHFPAALNKVPAHISLFHHLPSAELTSVLASVRKVCAGVGPIEMRPLAPRFLGRGVALAYEAPALTSVHRALADIWASRLTAQDRQPFKAHVTIQNKVAPDEARTLLAAMQAANAPSCRVEGIDVWRYLGGPWEAVDVVLFGRIPNISHAGAASAFHRKAADPAS